MSNSIPINSFDRGKPFYPLIINYLVFLIGFKELAARGIIKNLEKQSGVNAGPHLSAVLNGLLNKLSTLKTDVNDIRQQVLDMSNGLSRLLGPLSLKSKFHNDNIMVEIDDIANDLMNNFSYLIQFSFRSAGSLLILAHEISKDKPWHDKGPLWEFLRHCRNAAAHGGIFTFKGKEPCRPAEWGHFRIERALLGTPLFKDERGLGFLSPGDPIGLLWDIEQAYPNMKA